MSSPEWQPRFGSDTIVFDEAELRAIRDAVGVLNAKRPPRLKVLSAQDRKELPKMGESNSPWRR